MGEEDCPTCPGSDSPAYVTDATTRRQFYDGWSHLFVFSLTNLPQINQHNIIAKKMNSCVTDALFFVIGEGVFTFTKQNY